MAQSPTKPYKLPVSMETTLSILRQLRYQASIDVLAHGLKSKVPAIRAACLQGLLERGGPLEQEVVLQHVSDCDVADLVVVRDHIPELLDAIDQGLISPQPEQRQSSLIAIGKFEIESRFSYLVDAVCDTKDPQQIVAMELLSRLARSFGDDARCGDSVNRTKRTQLLMDLMRAIESYPSHRVGLVFDWWAAAAHWEDPFVIEILSNAETDESTARLKSHLLRSPHKEAMQLIAGILWSRSATDQVLIAISRRTDNNFLLAISELFKELGTTAQLKRNLMRPISFVFLSTEVIRDPQLSLFTRCCLVEMLTLRVAPPEEVLPPIGDLLKERDPAIVGILADILEQQKPINSDIAVMALSDSLSGSDIESSTPPPWKESMRDALNSLIENHNALGKRICSAIVNMLKEFRCDKLLEKTADWPPGHLAAFAKLTRIAQPSFIDLIITELNSQNPQRRQRGLLAARAFGLDQALWELVACRVDDPVEDVRIEAIRAMSDSRNHQNAIDLLQPLISEQSPAVAQVIHETLQNLRGS
jgi:hypothetical protein